MNFKIIIFIERLIFFFLIGHLKLHFPSCQLSCSLWSQWQFTAFWAETNLFHVDINWESFLWCQQNDSKTAQVTGARSSVCNAMALWLDDGNQIRHIQIPKSIVMNNCQISWKQILEAEIHKLSPSMFYCIRGKYLNERKISLQMWILFCS